MAVISLPDQPNAEAAKKINGGWCWRWCWEVSDTLSPFMLPRKPPAEPRIKDDNGFTPERYPNQRAQDQPDVNSPSREEFDAKLATTAAQIETSEAKVDARLAEFDTSVKTGFAELRADISRMQMEMHKNTLDIIRWGIGVALTMAAISISVLTFVVKNSAEKGGEKAPIVIYAQPQAPVAPPAAIDK